MQKRQWLVTALILAILGLAPAGSLAAAEDLDREPPTRVFERATDWLERTVETVVGLFARLGPVAEPSGGAAPDEDSPLFPPLGPVADPSG